MQRLTFISDTYITLYVRRYYFIDEKIYSINDIQYFIHIYDILIPQLAVVLG